MFHSRYTSSPFRCLRDSKIATDYMTCSICVPWGDSNKWSLIIFVLGLAVAQAVSRWLSTAAVQVRIRAACGVFGGQSSIGAGFLRELPFPQPIIPPIFPSSSLQFHNLIYLIGNLGRVIIPSQGCYLSQTQKKHRHPCLEWDSKPRCQR
jgi:hypothetical protein